jgi:hypothetical protein
MAKAQRLDGFCFDLANCQLLLFAGLLFLI